ncbi:MAG: right-handed parallel beta-helix repeat-containing protein [Alphaproteobacteria bacterium]|nr:right-handed parallel beta-helix repeat-containing protein [Alphaproteobacteria bacterium]MCB9695164.1 right-handed parallel beta-helix repeat-containing protein [Alphaproteobacteria bacterium]
MMTWFSFLSGLAFAADVNVGPGDDLTQVTSSLQPGNTVLFDSGTYSLDGTVYWSGIGTEAEPIVFRAKDGATVVLQNNAGGSVANISDSDYIEFRGLIFEGGGDIEYNRPSGLRISNSSHITLEDCKVRNVYGTALYVDGNSSGMVFRHNELTGTMDGSGMYVGCGDASCWMQDSVIEFNLVHDVEGTGMYFAHGTQANRIQHNVVFATRDSGLYMGSTVFGPQNTVVGNAIWRAGGDGIYLQGSALVQNNVIFEIEGDGFYTRTDDGSLVDLQFSHNTIVNTGGYAAYLQDWYSADGMVFANNALANPLGRGLRWEDELEDPYGTGTSGVPDTTNYISHNVVTGLVEGFDTLARPTYVVPGGGVSDFVGIDDFDFYPTSSSVLRDNADQNGQAYLPELDFNGSTRSEATLTVGAYEYDGDGNPGWIVQEGFKSLDPSTGGVDPQLTTGCCGGGKKDTTPTEALLFLPWLSVGWLFRRQRKKA